MASIHSDKGWLLIAFRFHGKLVRIYPGIRDTPENRSCAAVKQIRELIKFRRWGDLRTLFPRQKDIPWFNDHSKAIIRDDQPQDRIIYFLRAETGQIKIGSTTNLAARLGNLQIGSAAKLECLKAVPGSYRLERLIHTRFADLKIHSEWFRPADELLSFIDGLNITPGVGGDL